MSIDYGALFGVDEGGNEQEVADPANETEETQGEEEQAVAEPAAEETEPDAKPETEAETKDEQPPQERAHYAAARRKAEQERDEAVKKAKEEAQEEARHMLDEAFRTSGLTDPYTGKAITSKEEFDAYRARYEAEKKAAMMKNAGMTEGEFAAFVAGLPEVRQAREAQQKAEQAAQQAREREAKQRLDEQLREIGALDPSIRELSDLAKMPTYPRFYELVKKGNDLVDAYKLANYDTLTASAAAKSRQATLNAAQSKRHLNKTDARGAGAATVPADVAAEYRAFNPDASDAEIARHYNNYLKK